MSVRASGQAAPILSELDRRLAFASDALAPDDAPSQGDWVFAGVFGRHAVTPKNVAPMSVAPMTVASPVGGHALLVGAVAPQSAIASGAADQSSVVALAVTAARSLYAAATGGTLSGAGLTIGILSDSFNDQGGMASDIANGLLPAASQIHILEEGTGEDEGRAMAQLIYDIAPGATIDFYTATDSETDFANGIGALQAAGCNVIVDDVLYTDEPFYQDTGVITAAVESVVAAGVDYFTAASNSGTNFYESAFQAESFALPGIGASIVNNAGGSLTPYEAVALTRNPVLDLTLQWTQPFGSNAYDLGVALYRKSGGTYTLVDHFANLGANNANTITPDPILQIDVSVSLSAGTYYIAVYDAAGTIPSGSAFKIISFQDSNLAFTGVGAGVGSGADLGHELVPGANTVAAINVAETPAEGGPAIPVVESYSSAGPGETYVNAAGTLLATPINDATPDFAATDGTGTSVFPVFDGTSAAAPNAAAVALLMLQADGRLAPVQISTLLARSAIATATAVTGGAGLIQANIAVSAAITAAATPIWTAQSGSTLWSVAANWSDDRAPGAADPVSITDGLGLFAAAYAVTDDVASVAVAALLVDGGARLPAIPTLTVLAGDALTAGTVALGTGTIALAGTLIESGSLAGNAAGLIAVGAQGALSVGGSASGRIAFSGIGGIVAFTTTSAATLTSGLVAVISGFAAGDVIDLAGIPESQVAAIQVSGDTASVVTATGAVLAVLDVAGGPTQLGFTADANGGTELVACYLEGTRIATPAGERAIETLAIGEPVLTALGAARPIRWIGRRRYAAARVAANPELRPIRLPAGCLARGLPHRDLFVSRRHAMLIDGVLIPANRLLGWNGVAAAERAGDIAYVHIELDTHDAILAEGAASESYADSGNRFMFDNAGECASGPADEPDFCAPRLADRDAR